MIPQPDECFRLLKKYQVPDHIMTHSRIVCKIALYLCQALNQQGEKIDPALVEAGSLLHDISKIEGLHTGESHPQAGARLLAQLDYPEVSEVVRQHVLLDDGAWQGPITEATLVHYADKRVKHTTIVSLAERFHDLKVRYGRTPPALAWLEDLEGKSRLLEERIFGRLGIRPEALGLVVNDEP